MVSRSIWHYILFQTHSLKIDSTSITLLNLWVLGLIQHQYSPRPTVLESTFSSYPQRFTRGTRINSWYFLSKPYPRISSYMDILLCYSLPNPTLLVCRLSHKIELFRYIFYYHSLIHSVWLFELWDIASSISYYSLSISLDHSSWEIKI